MQLSIFGNGTTVPLFASSPFPETGLPKKISQKDFLGKGETCVKGVIFALARKSAKRAVFRRGGGVKWTRTTKEMA